MTAQTKVSEAIIGGRAAVIEPHDTGIKLKRGPIIVHLIRDANDPDYYLDKDGHWTTTPHMCDAHNQREAAEQFIAAHADKPASPPPTATPEDDVREAAERLLRHNNDSYSDRRMVADAYLAEHPADDREPLTFDDLESAFANGDVCKGLKIQLKETN